MKRVLIVKMWALGDIVMATPLISTLHLNFPGVEIDWIADATHAEILRGHPGIANLDVLPTGEWRRKLRRGDLAGWIQTALQIHRRLKARQYDAVINCHPDKSWTRLLCPAAIRIGLYSTPAAPINHVLYTQALMRPKTPSMHNTEHYLLAAKALGCETMARKMSVGRMEDEDRYISEFLRSHSLIALSPMVVIAPRTTAENRCWEPARFAQIADRVTRDFEAQIVFTASAADLNAVRQIAQMADCPITIATGTTLPEYAALLRHADLVISGDTSAMHIAAAVGTPYLALFGPTPVHERAPMVGVGKGIFHPLPCAPCDSPHCINPIFRECMELHTVEAVVQKATLLLQDVTRKKARSS